MSSRRQLVSRARRNEDLSSAQRPRDSDATHQHIDLPPYEPPSCPLTASAKRALDDLTENHDYSKYKKHLGATVTNITNSIGDVNERLAACKQVVQRAANKRRNQGTQEEKTDAEVEAEQYAAGMEKKVAELTTKAEIALRDLIDYGDELAMKDSIMKDISENVVAAPAPRSAVRRPRSDDSDEDGENDDVNEEEAAAADVPMVSAVELLKKAKEDYATNYASKSMRQRYDTNDYKQFKRTVHDAIHGPDAPPLPHARTWFAEDHEDATANSRRRPSTDDDDEDEDEDPDVYIASETVNLKCPLTLQFFKEPYSNHICSHTFEKSAILDYHAENGVAFVVSSQRARGPTARQGPKQVRCPQVGCEAMLELKDFYEDQLRLRQVRRAAKRTPGQLEEDDEELAPRGSQRTRPESVDDEGDSVDVDEDRRKSIAKVKREQASRGPSMAPRPARRVSSDEEEEEDEDEADEMEDD